MVDNPNRPEHLGKDEEARRRQKALDDAAKAAKRLAKAAEQSADSLEALVLQAETAAENASSSEKRTRILAIVGLVCAIVSAVAAAASILGKVNNP